MRAGCVAILSDVCVRVVGPAGIQFLERPMTCEPTAQEGKGNGINFGPPFIYFYVLFP
jgi:hypothetical protein